MFAKRTVLWTLLHLNLLSGISKCHLNSSLSQDKLPKAKCLQDHLEFVSSYRAVSPLQQDSDYLRTERGIDTRVEKDADMETSYKHMAEWLRETAQVFVRYEIKEHTEPEDVYRWSLWSHSLCSPNTTTYVGYPVWLLVLSSQPLLFPFWDRVRFAQCFETVFIFFMDFPHSLYIMTLKCICMIIFSVAFVVSWMSLARLLWFRLLLCHWPDWWASITIICILLLQSGDILIM